MSDTHPEAVTDVERFLLPASSLLSPQSRAVGQDINAFWRGLATQLAGVGGDHARAREIYRQEMKPLEAAQRAQYDVDIIEDEIAGRRVDIVTPTAGAPRYTLVNLHGGGFVAGDREGARIEAIPIAATAHARVICVDYRLAPEHQHPSAVEDAAAVIAALTNSIGTERLGVFGSSAGALLAAQTIALLIERDMRLPEALGLFALGATAFPRGDSTHIVGAIEGLTLSENNLGPYFESDCLDSPPAFPIDHQQILGRFPPTLLFSSVRDLGLSSVCVTHARLVALGVAAELHVWEGLRHCFYYHCDLEESRQAYEVAANFFKRRLLGR